MSNDDFLDGLTADWQSRKVELAEARRQMEQREQAMRKALVQIYFALAVFLLGAAGFAWSSWLRQDWLYALGAIAFLCALPFLLAELRLRRRMLRTDYLEGGNSLLERGLRQAHSNLRLLMLSRWVSGFLALFALAAIALAVAGLAPIAQAAFISGSWALVAAASFRWQKIRLAEARTELANYRAMLAEFPPE